MNTKNFVLSLDLNFAGIAGLKLEWNRENQTITGLRDNFLLEWIMINSFLYDGQYSSDINSIFQKNYPYILLSVLDTSKTIKEQINSLNLYFYIFLDKVFRNFYLYPRLGIGIGFATSLESRVFRLTLGPRFKTGLNERLGLDIGIDFVHKYFFRTRTALNEANFNIGIEYLIHR
ncbi:MAG: hypothetical protein N2247_01760 [Leptospiraceae bacterium]|nr:hypothetical protein [Leptospiraceae bacterium]